MKPLKSLLAPAVLALMFVSCAGEETVTDGDPFGTGTWVLVSGSVDGAQLVLVDDAPVTFLVDNGEVGGRSACNSYGGPISATDGVVTIGPGLVMTEMACLADGVMDLEAAYLAALERVTAVGRDGDALVLSGEGIHIRFSPQPEEEPASLTGTAWVLDTLVIGDSASTPAAEANLTITETGEFTGSTGCNSMFGNYDGATGSWSIGTTKMSCKSEVMTQETLMLEILGANPTLTIDGALLTITDLEGRALVYRAG